MAELHPILSASEPPRKTLWKDAVAGLINAVVSVPDGLASAALAGVNPIYGLYTGIAAHIAGSLLVSAQFMQITTTSTRRWLRAKPSPASPMRSATSLCSCWWR